MAMKRSRQVCRIKGDVDLLKNRAEGGFGKMVDYMSAVFPGGSVTCLYATLHFYDINSVLWSKGFQLYQAQRRTFLVEKNIQRAPSGTSSHVRRNVGRVRRRASYPK